MTRRRADVGPELARLYDLDLAEDPGDVGLYQALARRTGGPIVELGVGTGRVAVPLAAAGYGVTGIDIDGAMLDRARALAGATPPATTNLTLIEDDALEARSALDGRFRLAILALNSILLFSDALRQRAALGAIARLLAPDGIAVVDAWQPQPDDLVRMDGRLSLEWLRGDTETGLEVAKLSSAWYDASSQVVEVTTLFDESAADGTVRRRTRRDRLRLLTADELVGAAEAAGLEVEQLAGDYDLRPYGPGSERVVLIARRPATVARSSAGRRSGEAHASPVVGTFGEGGRAGDA